MRSKTTFLSQTIPGIFLQKILKFDNVWQSYCWWVVTEGVFFDSQCILVITEYKYRLVRQTAAGCRVITVLCKLCFFASWQISFTIHVVCNNRESSWYICWPLKLVVALLEVMVIVIVVFVVVALHRAQLVLGWVTVCGYTILVFNQSHPGLLSLAIPLWIGAMSTADGLSHR